MKQIGPKFSEEQQQNDEHEAEIDDTIKLASIISKRASSTNPPDHTITDPVENTAVAENLGEVASETSATVEAQAVLDDYPLETAGMPDRPILHAELAGISRGKARLLSGPRGLCRLCKCGVWSCL